MMKNSGLEQKIVDFKLRSLKIEDATSIARYANNIKIWNNVRNIMPHPYHEKDAENFIRMMSRQKQSTNFAVEYRDEAIGIVGISSKHDIYRMNGELGFWLGEPFWNLGIMSRAVAKMVGYGFSQMKLHRIYAEVFSYNYASGKVLEKNGFRKEAVLKEAAIKNEKLFDVHIYARLRTET